MSLTLTRMRALLRKGLGNLDSNDLTDDEADELLNLSLWDLDARFPFKEKECLVTAPTVAGTFSYALPNNLDAIRTVAIVTEPETGPGEFVYLHEMTPEWYNANAHEDDEAARAMPQFWMRRNDALILWPIPDQVYTIRMENWRTVASLLSGSVDTPSLPRNWHEIVVEGAITRGHYYKQDYNLARQAENFRVSHERGAVLVTAKEQEGIRYAGLQPIDRWPDGVNPGGRE